MEMGNLNQTSCVVSRGLHGFVSTVRMCLRLALFLSPVSFTYLL